LTDGTRISASLISGLRDDIIARRIRSGMARLDQHAGFLQSLDPASEHAAQIIWRLAQWVDAGWRDVDLIRELLARTPASLRSNLPLRDYAAIRIAEGMIRMSLEDPDEAIEHFNSVLLFSGDLDDRELLGIAHFWKARCQRKKGEYDTALTHTIKGRDLALECGFARMAAVMRVLESWILFQKGKHREALKTLGETEAALRDTDDSVVLGNIQSTYGRIYRQEGRYDRAILHFTNAIDEYRKLTCQHPHLARTLANMAYVKRLVGLELRRKIDVELARKRHAGGRLRSGETAPGAQRDEFVRLREEAFSHLNEAAAIYAVHPNHRGAGTVHLDRGLLHLDGGELDLAEQEAAQAFALGEEKDDAILMARARLLQCIVENAKLEEGIEEDPRRHAQSALDYIREAIDLARTTQNRRLLARVHTWHGLTLSNDFFAAHDAVIEALNTASSYLEHAFHDTAWEDLRMLKTRVLHSNTVDETLLAWSQGSVGNRSFREISEQFAEIIIPKVWEMEGRKIARVATRLSISPKKVRRALIRAGLLRRQNHRRGAASASE
jgi:tetratricopeptide (TPR) repeat protein